MGLTITSPSNTLVLGSGIATYNATAHGMGGLLYVKYTKGNEDGVSITFSYKSKGLDTSDRYNHISLNASTKIISPTTYILNASGNYRIPITWTAEETGVQFAFAQYGAVTLSGSMAIDFREAE